MAAYAQTYRFVTIDFPGATSTSANGINNAGTIVGCYTTATNGDTTCRHGFELKNGVFTKINVSGALSTVANGIDGNGDIVGTYETTGAPPTPTVSHGFLIHNGTITKLVFPGAAFTTANSVNNSLQVVGNADSNAYIWHNGTFTKFTLPSTSGGPTVLNGINNAGEIVGAVFTNDDWRAFLKSGGDLDYFAAAGTMDDRAFGVNGHGDVVGDFTGQGYIALNPEAGESTGDVGEKAPTLHKFMVPGSLTTTAMSINYNRVIVGNYFDSAGHVHGFAAFPQ